MSADSSNARTQDGRGENQPEEIANAYLAGTNTSEAPKRRPLTTQKSFWGLAITQFLGAFNDNLYKQTILLLAVPVGVAAVAAAANAGKPNGGEDLQGWATMLFSLPFVLFSGYAGFLSDRYSKRSVIVLSKFAEIVVMFMGMFAFLAYNSLGTFGTWTVLVLMGTQSAFFGPGKYGILPELFEPEDAPRANGLILMTTFLAIILGTVVAGFLFDTVLQKDPQGNPMPDSLWIASAICVGIAVVGTWTSTWIRWTKPAEPDSKLTLSDCGVSPHVRTLLWNDMPLLKALFVSCVFWMVSGIAVPVVNRLGVSQLGVDKTATSLLVGAIAIGIMVGSLLAAVVFKKTTPRLQVTIGLIGMFCSLMAMGFWHPNGDHVLGYRGSFIGLMVMGVFAAMYAVPLQVFLQQRPPADCKGRMIGTMNQANFVGILASGPLYQVFEYGSRTMGWPISSIFWMLAALILPLPILYRLGK